MRVASSAPSPDPCMFLRRLVPADRPLGAQLFERAAVDRRAESAVEVVAAAIDSSRARIHRADDSRGVGQIRRIADTILGHIEEAAAYASYLLESCAARGREAP